MQDCKLTTLPFPALLSLDCKRNQNLQNKTLAAKAINEFERPSLCVNVCKTGLL